MVVSRLLAGCRVDASASRPLDSASAATSAYQRPAASCPLAHFFPLASVCWLVIVSPLVARLHLASPFVAQPPLASILDPPSSLVPAGCCVASCRTASASRRASGSRVASCGTFALHPPARPLLHRNFRSLFQFASVCWLVIASPLVVPPPPCASASRRAAGSRVASCGTFALNLPARPLSHRHCRCPLSRRRGHRQRPQMHGALSRRRHRQRPLFIQHVHLRRRIVIFTAQPSTIIAQLSSYLGGR